MIRRLVGYIPGARPLWRAAQRYSAQRAAIREFKSGFDRFCQLAQASPRFTVRWEDRLACLRDNTATTGFDAHYVYHCAWAARVVAHIRPEFRVDISSCVRFCTQLSAFVPVRFYDYRPANIHLSNLAIGAADLTSLPFDDVSISSLSCMHVVEHIGLGRYGDPLAPNDDLKAMSELKRVLAPGGSLLFVVPIGRPMIRFNGHRIYGYTQIMEHFADLELGEFSMIPDDSASVGLIANADPALADHQNYACGCFWFRRNV